MAVSEFEDSPVLTLQDIHRALADRGVRTQQSAQAIVLLRLHESTPAAMREQLGIDQGEFDRAEALTSQALEVVATDPDLLLGDPRLPLGMALGQLLAKMQEIMATRVRHAEQILMLRASGWRVLAEIQRKMGVSDEEFTIASGWLKDAGLELREDEPAP